MQYAQSSLELRLPRISLYSISNSDVSLWIGSNQDMPKPLELIEVYTKEGAERRGVPGMTPGHRTNSRNYYQWEKELTWTKEMVRVRGFKVQTGPEGNYRWFIVLTGQELTCGNF